MAVETKTEIKSLADIVRLVRKDFSVTKETIILEEEMKLITYKAAIKEKGVVIDKCMESLMPQLEGINNLTIIYNSLEQLKKEFMECLKKPIGKEMQQTEARKLMSGEYTFEINHTHDGLFREQNVIQSRTLLVPYEKRLEEELRSLEGVGLDTSRSVYLFRTD